MDQILISRLSEDKIPEALELAWEVFQQYESPDYEEKGSEIFRSCLSDEKYLTGIEYYGAFDGEKMAGMIGIRRDKKHICFVFVRGEYHRRGIASKMFQRMLEDYEGEDITLNSSPYGLPFYKKLGWIPTGEERTTDGIRYTPMIWKGHRD